jgi:hypothetical protein
VQSSPESKVSQLEVYAADSTTYTQETTMITVALAGTKGNSCAKAKEEKTIALHCTDACIIFVSQVRAPQQV